MEIVLFDKSIHDRSQFDCGEDQINSYLKEQLSQDIKVNACRCYILKNNDSNSVVGFITLSASSLEREKVNALNEKKLPKYLKIPSLLIGRMGVDKQYQGKKYGDLLIYKAIDVAKTLPLGITLIEVEAKNQKLTTYYQRLGFILLETKNKYDVLVKKI